MFKGFLLLTAYLVLAKIFIVIVPHIKGAGK
jgi:hypothetical protein